MSLVILLLGYFRYTGLADTNQEVPNHRDYKKMYPSFVYTSYEVSLLENKTCVTNCYSLVYFMIKWF